MGYIEDLRKLIGHKRIVLNGSLVIIENKDGKILMQKKNISEGQVGGFPEVLWNWASQPLKQL